MNIFSGTHKAVVPPNSIGLHNGHGPARMLLCLWGVVLMLSVAPRVLADPNDSNDVEVDFFSMSLDELVEEPYQVFSAARNPQSREELSVPVTVITREDIHYSGLTSIPELLYFVVGVDVQRYDRNRIGVGVRGLHGVFSDRTLILLNNRNVMNLGFGGMEWQKLPVMIEDIERIEIVRGPGGGVWGANAESGVINIITREPGATTGTSVSSTLNEYGDTYTHVRLDRQSQQWDWFVSLGYEDQSSSDHAGAGEYTSKLPAAFNTLIGYDTYQAQDTARFFRMNSEATYHRSEQTDLNMGIRYVNQNLGPVPYMGYNPQTDIRSNVTQGHVRLDHSFSEQTHGSIEWYSNFDVTHSKMFVSRYYFAENDVDAQLNTTWGNHQITAGLNLRFLHINTDPEGDQEIMLVGEPINEDWVGCYWVDTLPITERLTLEGQARFDWYSGSQRDWSGRAAALYALDSLKEHVLRLAIARSFRAPNVGFRLATVDRVDLSPLGYPAGTYLGSFETSEDLKNENTYALEAGYTGTWRQHWSLQVNGYYQRYEHLIGIESLASTPPASVARFNNICGADSFGGELEIARTVTWGKLSAWYAYNNFEPDQPFVTNRDTYPSKNKAGGTLRVKLNDQTTINSQYTYRDAIPLYGANLASISTLHRWDLTVTHAFGKVPGELMLGVWDVFNKDHEPAFTMANFTAHTIPGRTFFARLQLNF